MLCKCGCGQETHEGKQFIHGHNICMMPKEMKATCGFKGKSHSKETKQKISESKKNRNTGEDNPFYGKTHSIEVRKIISKKQSGKNNYRWQPIGCERITKDGIKIKTKSGWILKHRLIAMNVLGRKLKSDEVVHHIDKNNLNNSNSNLLICTASYHNSLHRRLEKIRKEA